MLRVDPTDKKKLIDPLFAPASRKFWVGTGILLAIFAWGLFMYIRQVILGLGQTGMDRPTYWGVYMVNFIFFIGISHAGTLISAILRVTGAEWRRPITRVAEAVTAFALIVGTLQIIIDMGRPERLLFAIIYGRVQSPILWDIISVTLYFLGSLTYLYLPLIPDAALLRDNCPADAPAWRRKLYSTLAWGWRGNREQWVRLEKAIAAMAIFIIPVAISVHSIISWILATTVQPGWHSTIFGPYFVVGAIFSGIGALFIAMTAVRKSLGLENYMRPLQYRNLKALFVTMSAIWFYFTFAEHLGIAAGQQVDEFPILASKLWGDYAFSFWVMILLMTISFWVLVVPGLIPDAAKRVPVFRPRYAWISASAAVAAFVALNVSSVTPAFASFSISDVNLRSALWGLIIVSLVGVGLGTGLWFKKRLVTASVFASVLVVIGMWLERWNIIVPTMTHPRLAPFTTYQPTITEFAITAGSVSLFILLFLGFFRLFPAISIWEVAEGRVIDNAQSKISIPQPESSDNWMTTEN